MDPLAAERTPEETTLEIIEDQLGISYAKLFLPYVQGAKSIKIYDPYIRLQYQIFNLMNFCEIIVPPQGTVKLDLVTGYDDYQKSELKRKMDDLKSGLIRDHIDFNYTFDNNLHDRWIETDTGCLDQTRRKCKATTITYMRLTANASAVNGPIS